MIIIKTTDFVGKFLVPKNNYTDLQSYIDRYEEAYLVELLGKTLYDLFKADLANPTQADIFADIYDPFDEDFGNDIISSNGMKDMLVGFVYFEYMREYNVKPTTTGNVIGVAENSGPSQTDNNFIYDRYNASISSYQAIQWKIMQTRSVDYPTYNGRTKSISYWCL